MTDHFYTGTALFSQDSFFGIGSQLELGTSIILVAFNGTSVYTPALFENIPELEEIHLYAPPVVFGKNFAYWKIIYSDNSEDFMYENDTYYNMIDDVEIRAVYANQLWTEESYGVAGPIGLIGTTTWSEDSDYEVT